MHPMLNQKCRSTSFGSLLFFVIGCPWRRILHGRIFHHATNDQLDPMIAVGILQPLETSPRLQKILWDPADPDDFPNWTWAKAPKDARQHDVCTLEAEV